MVSSLGVEDFWLTWEFGVAKWEFPKIGDAKKVP